MSCSMTTMVSVRFSSAISAASRAVPSRAETGGRLVEEQQPRLRGERDGDLERAALAVGEALGRDRARVPARPTRASTSAASSCAPESAPRSAMRRSRARAPPAARPARSRAPCSRRTGSSPGTSARCRGARSRAASAPVMSRAVEPHLAAVGLVAAGQHVEAGRLAGAVGPHDAGQPPGVERKRDVLEHDARRRSAYAGASPRTAPWLQAALPATSAGATGRCARRHACHAGDALGLEQHHRHEQQPVPEQPRRRCTRRAGRARG